jgi:hypothetical protein
MEGRALRAVSTLVDLDVAQWNAALDEFHK